MNVGTKCGKGENNMKRIIFILTLMFLLCILIRCGNTDGHEPNGHEVVEDTTEVIIDIDTTTVIAEVEEENEIIILPSSTSETEFSESAEVTTKGR